MAQPPPYVPAHSFVTDSATLANFPGQALDVEFQDVKATTDAIRTNLALIQRDDGALVNGSVTYDTLAASVQSNGLAGAAAWVTATAYVVGTPVYQANSLYRCLVAHTSGVFATDLAASKWLLLTALPAGPTGAQGIQGVTGNTGATGPGYTATSVTSNVIASSGSKSFQVAAGLAYTAGARVRAADTGNPTVNYMEGVVTSYSGTTLVFTADLSAGSGTLTSWNINVAGNQGATGPSGALGVSGTPVASQFGIWTNATTQKGLAITGLVKGNGASDPAAATAGSDYMAPGTTSAITIGFTVTPNNIGTVSSGTTTPNLALGNYQYYTNNGAHTLAAPTSDGAVDILITNGASAGAITFSGFTVSSSVGDALTTTNTSKFIISIRRINSVSTYMIKALQ